MNEVNFYDEPAPCIFHYIMENCQFTLSDFIFSQISWKQRRTVKPIEAIIAEGNKNW